MALLGLRRISALPITTWRPLGAACCAVARDATLPSWGAGWGQRPQRQQQRRGLATGRPAAGAGQPAGLALALARRAAPPPSALRPLAHPWQSGLATRGFAKAVRVSVNLEGIRGNDPLQMLNMFRRKCRRNKIHDTVRARRRFKKPNEVERHRKQR